MAESQMKIKANGEFHIPSVRDTSYLYLPLFNKNGLLSVITPQLMGDIKLDLNHYYNPPQSIEDIQHGHWGRHVYFHVDGTLYSTSGKTPRQKLANEAVALSGGMLYQQVTRSLDQISMQTTSFVPTRMKYVELHQTILTNHSETSKKVNPTVMVPLYGRSADNLRDHRHVTALLNRVHVVPNGLINQPTLSFDERGHGVNHHAYGLFAITNRHTKVGTYWPTLEEFVGEGEDLFYPRAPRTYQTNSYQIGQRIDGYEVAAGLAFEEVVIEPGQSLRVLFACIIGESFDEVLLQANEALHFQAFDHHFQLSQQDWENDPIFADLRLGNESITGWLRWVNLQPLMRRIYGNSFLPHHDYGRGGRGWRDLWQDLLAQILVQPEHVKSGILNHICGVRIDGSNATIIGHKPGEFIADRNRIVRVWSDHGAWGVLTTNLYIERTGDFELLLEKRPYFQDKFTHYTHQINPTFEKQKQPLLVNVQGEIYQGTVLEHFFIQNVIPYFNVGKHGNLRLEDADWNDGLDMARDLGETVAFTALYAANYRTLMKWLKGLQKQGHQSLEIIVPLVKLLEHAAETNGKKKQEVLQTYFNQVGKLAHQEKQIVSIDEVLIQLETMASLWQNHVNQQEYTETEDGQLGFFNGYYDNFGNRLETAKDGEVRMTLTGQVFPLMAQIASPERVKQVIKMVQTHLYHPDYQGLKLNTPLGEDRHHLGRLMGFAFGHKENGALFSHMSVMYLYSLLKNQEISTATTLLDGMMDYFMNFEKARILPGIPEYIDARGRGVYEYLTGSASWMILTLIDQLFGVSGDSGQLLIQPKLRRHHFFNQEASLKIAFASKRISIRFINPSQLDYEDYQINYVKIGAVMKAVHNTQVNITPTDIQNESVMDIYLEEKQ